MTIHQPVLLQEAINGLKIKSGDIIFDGTLGGGGYAKEILEKIGKKGILIATDLDYRALHNFEQHPARLHQKNFSEIKSILKAEGLKNIQGMVLDLGISSDQLATSGRGISFQNLNEKLDMNLSETEQKFIAAEILNTWEEEHLADIIFHYGEERAAKKIARAIVKERRNKKFVLVSDLVKLLEKEIGQFYWNKRIHYATKTFQALRITVNDELGHLEKALRDGLKVLKPGGRIAVVSFHSLEDRLVKKTFREWEDAEEGKRINKKVITPSIKEITENRRARSAKLRIFEKKHEKK